jgi:hypothetical protein
MLSKSKFKLLTVIVIIIIPFIFRVFANNIGLLQANTK